MNDLVINNVGRVIVMSPGLVVSDDDGPVQNV